MSSSVSPVPHHRARSLVPRGRALALLALVASALFLLPAGVARADDAGPPSVDSWALTPTGTDPNQPGARPTFSYDLDPGATVNDSLTVWNYGSSQLNFHIYATDAYNTQSGGFDLIPSETKPKDAGSWVTLEQDFVTLPPTSKVQLNFTIRVPANATPGDHTAGIVAASETPAVNSEGKHVILDRRVGSRLYLRVNGPAKPALAVENVASDYHPSVNPLSGNLDVTYTVRNTGNVRLGARQRVAVSDVFGDVAEATPAPLPELLPGNAVTITRHFADVAATFRLSTDVTVTPFAPKATGGGATGAELVRATSSVHTWAIPWSLIVLLVVFAVAIVLARRRSSMREPKPVVGSPPMAETA